MTIDKLPSGSYRIRHTENKRTYSVTTPVKPTKKEAWDLIQAKMYQRVAIDKPFSEACKEYIAVKSNVLSPSTIKAYDSYAEHLPKWFKSLDIAEIDNYALQRLVNEHAKDHKPKSTRNVYGFVLAVIRLFISDTGICATLPQKRPTNAYMPSLEDVKKLFEYSKGTQYYIGFRLASLSLRRSEICALTIDDLSEDDLLTINKALVVNKDNKWVVKPVPKTNASNRTIAIPHDLADMIRGQGYIFKGYPNTFDTYLRRNLPKMGIPLFSIHKLRHFFASYAHDLGYSNAQIQELGGWETSAVFETVYRHAMNKEQTKRKIASDFDV